MAKIQNLRNENDNIIYPITVANAVYIDKKNRLDTKLKAGVYISGTVSDTDTVEDIDNMKEDAVSAMEAKINKIANNVNSINSIVSELENALESHSVRVYQAGSEAGLKDFLIANAANTNSGLFVVENPQDIFNEEGLLIGQYWGDGTGKFVFDIRNYETDSLWTGTFNINATNHWILSKINNKIDGDLSSVDNIYSVIDSFDAVFNK